MGNKIERCEEIFRSFFRHQQAKQNISINELMSRPVATVFIQMGQGLPRPTIEIYPHTCLSTALHNFIQRYNLPELVFEFLSHKIQQELVANGISLQLSPSLHLEARPEDCGKFDPISSNHGDEMQENFGEEFESSPISETPIKRLFQNNELCSLAPQNSIGASSKFLNKTLGEVEKLKENHDHKNELLKGRKDVKDISFGKFSTKKKSQKNIRQITSQTEDLKLKKTNTRREEKTGTKTSGFRNQIQKRVGDVGFYNKNFEKSGNMDYEKFYLSQMLGENSQSMSPRLIISPIPHLKL